LRPDDRFVLSETVIMQFNSLRLDHIGIRVTDLAKAEAFYAKLGFQRDPEEDAPAAKACGLVHPTGLRIHLIYNGEAHSAGNVLLDAAVKRPGYTHAAFIVDSMDALVAWLARENIRISEGPVMMGRGRRNVCFIRDPDLNVLEFNEILIS
jgi:catechol 2,3-dioxygenase-like lactoylglutathione lyase family enzyme